MDLWRVPEIRDGGWGTELRPSGRFIEMLKRDTDSCLLQATMLVHQARSPSPVKSSQGLARASRYLISKQFGLVWFGFTLGCLMHQELWSCGTHRVLMALMAFMRGLVTQNMRLWDETMRIYTAHTVQSIPRKSVMACCSTTTPAQATHTHTHTHTFSISSFTEMPFLAVEFKITMLFAHAGHCRFIDDSTGRFQLILPKEGNV